MGAFSAATLVKTDTVGTMLVSKGFYMIGSSVTQVSSIGSKTIMSLLTYRTG